MPSSTSPMSVRLKVAVASGSSSTTVPVNAAPVLILSVDRSRKVNSSFFESSSCTGVTVNWKVSLAANTLSSSRAAAVLYSGEMVAACRRPMPSVSMVISPSASMACWRAVGWPSAPSPAGPAGRPQTLTVTFSSGCSESAAAVAPSFTEPLCGVKPMRGGCADAVPAGAASSTIAASVVSRQPFGMKVGLAFVTTAAPVPPRNGYAPLKSKNGERAPSEPIRRETAGY